MAHARAEVEAVVKKHEIGRIFPYLGHHLVEVVVFFLAQLPANGIHLEKAEVVVAHEPYHHVGAFLGFLGCVAKAVGPAPNAEACVHFCRLFAQRAEAFGKVTLETLAFRAAVDFCTVECPGVESIYVEFHAVGVVQPLEEVEVLARLLGRSSFVGVVYPREVLRVRRGLFGCSALRRLRVQAGENAGRYERSKK